MNSPLPPVSTQIASSSDSYGSGNTANSGINAGSNVADFADLLAGAAHTTSSPPARRSSNTNDGPNDQSPQTQSSTEADNKETESARRARSKKEREGKAGDSAQSDAAVTLTTPSTATVTLMPVLTDNSAVTGKSDGTASPEDLVNSSHQLSPLGGDPLAVQKLAAGEPALQSAANSPTSPPANKGSNSSNEVLAADIKTDSRHPAATAGPAPQSNSRDSDAKSAITPASAANPMQINAAAKTASLQKSPTDDLAVSSSAKSPNDVSDAHLVSDNKKVKQTSVSVGISGAESSADMSKSVATSALAHQGRIQGTDVSATALIPSAPSSAAVSGPVARGASESTGSSLSHAVAAVEATLDSVEHMRDAAHSSVELNLSFGDDARLAVRVQLRGGEVQTTFRTDSAELRQALSSAWRQQAPAVAASASDRPLRMADPVFTGGSGSQGSASTSTGGQADSRQTPSFTAAESSPPSSPRAQSQTSSSSSAASAPLRLPTSLRLNVFA